MKLHLLKKGILIYTLMIISALAIFTFSSCNKEETYNTQAPAPNGIYSNTGTQVRSWNQTYGPVKKGFKCEVQIGNYQGGTPTIEIHVSKNEEPFALKVTTEGASASYEIDF
ncbi:hypothetical protein [Muriicola soli]|uniref:Lipoprotein n=1 Tax=Muriicola soli TaxID=2507538 RepID=A0A411EC62_9FLAO|nr:hypothetical protein [Muriicola soli]QBA65336.1 hypothetical protein EQY75_12825 [Muriicola soli]